MASSIRLMSVSIPPHAIRGQDVKLECLYDMEGDKLYSIKWYRNGHEFYRYIPTDRPSTAIFDGNGIKVDVSNQLYGMIEYQYDPFVEVFWATEYVFEILYHIYRDYQYDTILLPFWLWKCKHH